MDPDRAVVVATITTATLEIDAAIERVPPKQNTSIELYDACDQAKAKVADALRTRLGTEESAVLRQRLDAEWNALFTTTSQNPASSESRRSQFAGSPTGLSVAQARGLANTLNELSQHLQAAPSKPKQGSSGDTIVLVVVAILLLALVGRCSGSRRADPHEGRPAHVASAVLQARTPTHPPSARVSTHTAERFPPTAEAVATADVETTGTAD